VAGQHARRGDEALGREGRRWSLRDAEADTHHARLNQKLFDPIHRPQSLRVELDHCNFRHGAVESWVGCNVKVAGAVDRIQAETRLDRQQARGASAWHSVSRAPIAPLRPEVPRSTSLHGGGGAKYQM